MSRATDGDRVDRHHADRRRDVVRIRRAVFPAARPGTPHAP
ncbi:hypothetical protein [Streptomyces sp. NPDC049887]